MTIGYRFVSLFWLGLVAECGIVLTLLLGAH